MAKAKFAKGDIVTFKGYSEDVEEADQLLVEGETYEVSDVNAAEKTVGIEIDNPDFNPKKKESEANPKTLLVDVFFDEIEAAAEEEEEEAPAPKGKAKAAAKAPAPKGKAKAAAEEEEEEGDDEGDDEEEEEEEEAPAPKSKAKAKTAAKEEKPEAKGKAKAEPKAKAKADAKGKAKAKAKAAPKEEEEEALPVLENEDEEIVELVEGAESILELAEELVEDSAALDYKLGGVLYHVRLGSEYKELDDRYKENGGFGLYVKERLNIEYRKAMYLIDIYFKFNQYGIDASKVQELGWTKCSKIAAVMTEDNAEELVELAEGSSVAELSDAIKESYKDLGGNTGGKEKRRKIAFKFRLWEDQATGVAETIKAVAQSMGFKDESDAFEHIVMEWAAEHPIEKKAKTKAAPKSEEKAAAPAGKAKVRAKA